MQHRALVPAAPRPWPSSAPPRLSACLTEHVQPTLSTAVVEARTAAQAKPPACVAGGLDQVSPVDAAFGFDDTQISAGPTSPGSVWPRPPTG